MAARQLDAPWASLNDSMLGHVARPLVMLYSYAIEIGLKELSTVKHGHSFYEIYKGIDATTQKTLSDNYTNEVSKLVTDAGLLQLPFKQILSDIETFYEARYKYEPGARHYSRPSVHRCVAVAVALTLKMNPRVFLMSSRTIE